MMVALALIPFATCLQDWYFKQCGSHMCLPPNNTAILSIVTAKNQPLSVWKVPDGRGMAPHILRLRNIIPLVDPIINTCKHS